MLEDYNNLLMSPNSPLRLVYSRHEYLKFIEQYHNKLSSITSVSAAAQDVGGTCSFWTRITSAWGKAKPVVKNVLGGVHNFEKFLGLAAGANIDNCVGPMPKADPNTIMPGVTYNEKETSSEDDTVQSLHSFGASGGASGWTGTCSEIHFNNT